MLSPDSGDETNRLLLLMVQKLDNNTLSPEDIGPQSFTPSAAGISINQLFSISLICSMIASFGALLGQQWITSYRRLPLGGSEDARHQRQRRRVGVKRWQLEPLLELALPMLLQASMIIFLVGMIRYLQYLNSSVALPCIIICWLGAIFLFATILFPLIDPYCPFKTPFSEAVRLAFAPGLRWLVVRDYDCRSFRRSTWGQHLSRVIGKIRRKLQSSGLTEELSLAISIGKLLNTSVNDETIHAMALNIPLLKHTDSLVLIYSDDVALSNLFQRYEVQSALPSADEVVYSTALTHLVLGAGEGNPERTNHFL